MRKGPLKIFFLGTLLWFGVLGAQASAAETQEKIRVIVFHLPECRACLKVIGDIIPPLERKYGSRVQWDYLNVTEQTNYVRLLSLGKQVGRELDTPTVLVGKNILVGVHEVADSLDILIAKELSKGKSEALMPLEGNGVDLLEHFKSFGPWAVVGAGLVDGFNPCAFTVIIFFISFLTLMGYRRREMTLIGLGYIAAVFLTYLALGLGLFKAFYSVKGFYLISKMIYLGIGSLSLYLGGLAIKDYIVYKRTGNTDAMALQLPRPIKNKIHAIVGEYYRKDKMSQRKALLGLFASALVVGFLISLLEAVCTGQLYLPTIVFVLKEGTLRARALFYLILYNIMFVVPLFLVLVAALGGVSSRQFEGLARKNLGLIKLAMAAVFLALGGVLVLGLL